jgi:arylformamidase
MWEHDAMNNDRAYANGAFIPGAESFPERWARDAAAFRQARAGKSRLGVPYGPGARQQFDLFLPDGEAKGLLVFIHGGYWMAFGREDWSQLAAGAAARGFACALPSYTLAPDARIAGMTVEMVRAVEAASEMVPGPVIVTGHSAGGHLAARMGCGDVVLKALVTRVVPISPLADLAPLMATTMNATLRLDSAEAAAESPARQKLRPGCESHVWVGAQERPAFLWQARLLSEEWNCPWTAESGRHHFDVIEGLADPNSALVAACLGPR